METSLLLKEKISESNLGDISYEYDKLRNPMKTFPNENITKVELAEYDNPIKSNGMKVLSKFPGIPEHRNVILHIINYVFCEIAVMKPCT